MHLALYNEAVVFDQATKLVFVCVWAHLGSHPSVQHAYLHARRRLTDLSQRIAAGPPADIPPGKARPPNLHLLDEVGQPKLLRSHSSCLGRTNSLCSMSTRSAAAARPLATRCSSRAVS